MKLVISLLLCSRVIVCFGGVSFLTWKSNSAGLFSQYVQTKILYAVTKVYSNRTLLLAPFKSPHYGNAPFHLCSVFVFPDDIQCSYNLSPQVEDGSGCYQDNFGKHQLAGAFLGRSEASLCYSGKLPLFAAKHNRDAILRAINLDNIPLKLSPNYAGGIQEAYNKLGLRFGEQSELFTVVHWRRGDQLRTRCKAKLDHSVNCFGAKELIDEISKYNTNQSGLVYIATNEEADSPELLLLREAGYKTSSDIATATTAQASSKEVDMSLFVVEVHLMMTASTFLSWGISEVNDVVEHYRMTNNKSWCMAADDNSVEESWCRRAKHVYSNTSNPSYFDGPTEHLKDEVGTKRDQIIRKKDDHMQQLQQEQQQQKQQQKQLQKEQKAQKINEQQTNHQHQPFIENPVSVFDLLPFKDFSDNNNDNNMNNHDNNNGSKNNINNKDGNVNDISSYRVGESGSSSIPLVGFGDNVYLDQWKELADQINLKHNNDNSTNSAVMNALASKVPAVASHNSSLKLVFIAGLAGSGHHLLTFLIEKCEQISQQMNNNQLSGSSSNGSNGITGTQCITDSSLSSLLFFQPDNNNNNNNNNNNANSQNTSPMGLFSADNNFTTPQAIDLLVQRIKQLQHHHEVSNGRPTALFVGLRDYNNKNIRDLSFPILINNNWNNDNTKNKNGISGHVLNDLALLHPDITMITLLTHQLNVPSTIWILQNTAQNILLYSGAISDNKLARILIHNADVLYMQLRLLKRHQFVCIDLRNVNNNYAAVTSDNSGGNHAEMVAYRNSLQSTILKSVFDADRSITEQEQLLNKQIKQYLSLADRSSGSGSSDTFSSNTVDAYHTSALQTRLKLIDKLCELK